MHTLRHAAELLAAGDSTDGLAAIAAMLGFTDVPSQVNDEARCRLRLAVTLRDVHVVRGPGALRALLVVALPESPLRVQLSEIATALASSTAEVLWLVVAAAGDEIGIACFTMDRAPRISALVANRRRIVASDAEALCSLAATSDGDDLLVHTRWTELLGREALTRRFYRTLEQRVTGLAQSLVHVPVTEATELALLTASRLLFLCFLQAKGWLNAERSFLTTRFDECMAQRGGFHGSVLLPLFFGTLNTPFRRRAPRARAFGQVPFLNGGLFTRTALERRYPSARFSDAALGELFAQLLDAYRFTAREDDTAWSEVAIDPEMLGRAFESLMAGHERRTSGAFYTPQPLVAHVADHALGLALAGDGVTTDAVRALLDGHAVGDALRHVIRERLRTFTVLDPACGSGAFLVYLLERVTGLYQAVGDTRPTSSIRRDVLTRVIHGVDINPTAVWLCELRLWLCVVIESDESRMSGVTPLPNLDCNVRVGDSLAGEAFAETGSLMGPPAATAQMRARYARASGARKAPLRRAVARDERQRALAAIDRALASLTSERRERLLALRSRDLFGERRRGQSADVIDARRLRDRGSALRRERRRLADGGALPFAYPSHFGHVHALGGFDLVIGNPPWVRLHNIPAASRAALQERFAVYRAEGWQPSFPGIVAPRGFGTQVDLAALFVERSLALARSGGTIALLIPVKLWRSLSGGAVRRLLASQASVRRVEDWTDAPCVFDAAVYPSCLLATRLDSTRPETSDPAVHFSVRRRSLVVEWCAGARSHRFSEDPASPWLLLPPDVRAGFDALSARGQPLGAGSLGRATMGVKCGCNDAFTVETTSDHGDRTTVTHLGREGDVERALLRPLLRGDTLTAWTIAPSRQAILWTHGPMGAPLDALPAGAARWLAPWRDRLASRSDLHGARAWWMLFRTEGADASRSRVVWGDFGRVPRAALLRAGQPDVPLNSCYVLPCDDLTDALALTALFNSPVAAAWLNALAEPARGGWHRYLAWTMSLLPLPREWARARELLAPLAERAMLGSPPTAAELTVAACRAYRVRRDAIAPLLAWSL